MVNVGDDIRKALAEIAEELGRIREEMRIQREVCRDRLSRHTLSAASTRARTVSVRSPRSSFCSSTSFRYLRFRLRSLSVAFLKVLPTQPRQHEVPAISRQEVRTGS
jgi:hypothetical protein